VVMKSARRQGPDQTAAAVDAEHRAVARLAADCDDLRWAGQSILLGKSLFQNVGKYAWPGGCRKASGVAGLSNRPPTPEDQ
jgi:hypothetical protein